MDVEKISLVKLTFLVLVCQVKSSNELKANELIRSTMRYKSWWAGQCDQIGQFLKGLGYKLFHKRGPNIWELFGLFRKMSRFMLKLLWLIFWATL